jgi:DNA-binding IclR family transcriptional regulator
MVERNGQDRAYHVGPTVTELAMSAVHQSDLVRRLHPFLEEFGEQVDETVHLLALEGSMFRFVNSVESSHALRTTSRVGTSYPA